MNQLRLLIGFTICLFFFLLSACFSDRNEILAPTETIITQEYTSSLVTSTSATFTPPATSSPMSRFLIVYAKDSKSEGKPNSQIWLFDSLLQESQLLFSTDPGSTIDENNIKWHLTNKDIIYYIQNESGGRWALWKFDLQQRQSTKITESFPSNPQGLMSDWSTDGQWVSLYAVGAIEGKTNISGLLINVETGESLTTNEFVLEWSPISPDQYIFYTPVIGDIPYLSINSVKYSDSSAMINLEMFPVHDLIWSPSGEKLIAIVGGEAAGGLYLYGYDFMMKRWSKLQQLETSGSVFGPQLSQSTHGDWIILNYFTKIFALKSDRLTDIPILLYESEFAIVKEWLDQPDRLIIFSNNELIQLSPDTPGEILKVIDFEESGLDNISKFDVSRQ